MQINHAGIKLIKHFETLSLNAYYCPAGKLTIGWGHTREVERGDQITEEKADELLWKDIAQAKGDIHRLAPQAWKLNDNQYSALCSFVFNVGGRNFGNSTLLKHVNAGKYELVHLELPKWIYASGKRSRGLVRRRHYEALLWEGFEIL